MSYSRLNWMTQSPNDIVGKNNNPNMEMLIIRLIVYGHLLLNEWTVKTDHRECSQLQTFFFLSYEKNGFVSVFFFSLEIHKIEGYYLCVSVKEKKGLCEGEFV